MAEVTRSGFGTAGYCTLCSVDDVNIQDGVDRRVGKLKPNGKYEYSATKVNEFLTSKGLRGVDRQVVYNHRKHVMHPKDKLVSAVKKRDLERGPAPQQVSEDEFLDSLVNVGLRKVQSDPDSVTIDQALKAVQIKKNSGKMGSGIQVLVGLMTGGPRQPTDDIVIEGEVKVL